MGRYSGALKLIGDVLRETKEELLTTVFVITHPPPSRTSVRGGIGGSLYVFCVFVLVGWSGSAAFHPDEGAVSRPDRLDDRVGDPCGASSLFRREKLT